MKPISALAVLALVISLGACASLQGPTLPADGETISYSVGPCFGFCPVYNVSVTPDGHVRFEGERHTATLGQQDKDGGAQAYRTISSTLASYRPASGITADTQCDSRMSDQQHYRIVWTAADGTQTALQHDKGCRSAQNDALNKALDLLPSKLGIADWAKQTTRPGVGRG
jgi:hypothetical protein